MLKKVVLFISEKVLSCFRMGLFCKSRKKVERTLSYTVYNNSGYQGMSRDENGWVALFTGMFTGKDDLNQSGIFGYQIEHVAGYFSADSTIITDYSMGNNEMRMLQRWLQFREMKLKKIHFGCKIHENGFNPQSWNAENNIKQLNATFNLFDKTPFESYGQKPFCPAQFVTRKQTDNSNIEIIVNERMNPFKILTMNLLPCVEATLTFILEDN